MPPRTIWLEFWSQERLFRAKVLEPSKMVWQPDSFLCKDWGSWKDSPFWTALRWASPIVQQPLCLVSRTKENHWSLIIQVRMARSGPFLVRMKVKVNSFSPSWLFVTLWTVAHHSASSMGFSRQEYWSGLPFPSPGDLPDSGIKPGSPALQADSLPTELSGKP